jgi:hypothetical protein
MDCEIIWNPMIKGIDLRDDGWWLLFAGGEEAGPFAAKENAEAFLDYLDNLQRTAKVAEEESSQGLFGNDLAEE